MHTHKHTYTHTRTRTNIHTRTHTHTHTDSHAPTFRQKKISAVGDSPKAFLVDDMSYYATLRNIWSLFVSRALIEN